MQPWVPIDGLQQEVLPYGPNVGNQRLPHSLSPSPLKTPDLTYLYIRNVNIESLPTYDHLGLRTSLLTRPPTPTRAVR